MKSLLFPFLLLFSIVCFSQNTPLPKTTTNGNLKEVTLFYENGQVMQHGFYTTEGELHGAWESYNIDGSNKCQATYTYGKKTGVWTYWSKSKITKIEYRDNKVFKIEEINTVETDKNNY